MNFYKSSLLAIWTELFLFFLFASLCFGFISYYGQFTGALHTEVPIDLSWHHLPSYLFFSLSRGLVAYVFSFCFSILWGVWAAKDHLAEKILISLLNILQSIPILGFMPGLVLLLISFFPSSNTGLELASILLIFTSQAWNMTFSIYHSLKTVPQDLLDCATVYNLSRFQKLRKVELPFGTISLIWNSMMSMAGGWFFLMLSEAFQLGNKDYRLPGIGSYMSVAARQGDLPAIFMGIIAMIILIVFLDQFLWRPLIVWSQKFRIESVQSESQTTSWFLNLLKRSHLIEFLSKRFQFFHSCFQNHKKSFKTSFSLLQKTSRLCLLLLCIALIGVSFFLFYHLKTITLDQWLHIGKMALLTFSRVILAILLGLSWTLPLGLLIGLSKKLSKLLEPFLQMAASFPASLLFPVVILGLKWAHISLDTGSVILLLMGSQWYILFNVIAGASSIPSDLKQVSTCFRFKRLQRFWRLYVPGIFPSLITGLLTASGGAWNTSIVAEYVSYNGQVWATPGLGSSINLAAQQENIPFLLANIVVMIAIVVLLNEQVWLKLYRYSEKRFSLTG